MSLSDYKLADTDIGYSSHTQCTSYNLEEWDLRRR